MYFRKLDLPCSLLPNLLTLNWDKKIQKQEGTTPPAVLSFLMSRDKSCESLDE